LGPSLSFARRFTTRGHALLLILVLAVLAGHGCRGEEVGDSADTAAGATADPLQDNEHLYRCADTVRGWVRGWLQGRYWVPNVDPEYLDLERGEVQITVFHDSASSRRVYRDVEPLANGGFSFDQIPNGHRFRLSVRHSGNPDWSPYMNESTDSAFARCIRPEKDGWVKLDTRQ
jgi:hypothetical protein